MPVAADSAIFRPVTRPPVKETRSISGWEDSGAPTVPPSPSTRFATPFGSPSSSSTSIISIVVCGVSSAGLITKALPAARAGAIFHAACSSGKFHGVIMPHTPTGSRTTREITAASPASTRRPGSWSAIFPK